MIDVLCGLILFSGTAAVVWWQNTRLTVLYDLSGVLEPAMRISQGDIPYLDFPFPYAPLAFVTQAALIRFTGAVYWHHFVYACVVAGLATLLTWRIVAKLLAETARPRLVSFILTLPLVVLGVYCIFPHPFYDPDAAFCVLLCIWVALLAERRGFPALLTLLTGGLAVVPLFVKQNIGLALLAGIVIVSTIGIAWSLKKKYSVRPYVLVIAGIICGLAIAFTIIYFTCGIDNYKYWTWTFATARRAPSFVDMLLIYGDWLLALWSVVFLVGAYFVIGNRDGRTSGYVIGVTLMAVPFLWPVIYLLIDQDASERAERLVALWPLSFIVAAAISYVIVRKLKGIAATLPFILIATAHGVFLSQQLWGSTYGIWPLLIILLALVVKQLDDHLRERSGKAVITLSMVIAATLLTAGGFYVYSNERLDYVNLEDGEMQHSKLPQLAGLSMRGDFLPDFDELIQYTEANIPHNDGVLYLPGEDLFFYTTGRRPHFPVQLFDVTNNPYNAVEIRERVLASDIEWIIVKNETEIEADSMIDSKAAIFELLKPDFRSVDSLNNYEIYKRRHADDPPDEDDDSDYSGGENDNDLDQ